MKWFNVVGRAFPYGQRGLEVETYICKLILVVVLAKLGLKTARDTDI